MWWWNLEDGRERSSLGLRQILSGPLGPQDACKTTTMRPLVGVLIYILGKASILGHDIVKAFVSAR